MTALLSLLSLSWLAATASAHPLGFGVLDLHEDRYALRISPEEGREADAVRVRWPSGCVSSHEVLARDTDGTLVREGTLRCDGAMEGELAIEGLGPELTVLVRVHGESEVALHRLDARHPRVVFGASRGAFASFALLGLEHAATGIDHLLFLIGVVFLAGTVRRTVLAVTAFTLGHALTLGLATLGALAVDVPTVELCIALSLVALAFELTRDATSLGARYPAVLSGLFGLLHGLGFASALGETGLPIDARVVPLIAFHLGIEAVQLALVLLVLGVLAASPTRRPRITLGAAYAVGVTGVCLMVERF